MKIFIYRPDKKQPYIDFDCLYTHKGALYKEPEEKQEKHPLEKITKAKIASSFVEVSK